MTEDVIHNAYSKENKPEDMSEDEWRFSREEFMDDGYEAVTKARMFYRFDNYWFFKIDFLNAVAIIMEDDIVWKDYIQFLDNNSPAPELPYNTALFRISSAVMWCYRRLSQIKLEMDEIMLCIESLRTMLQMYVMDHFDEVFSEEELTLWGRNRENWLVFEVAYSNYLSEEEVLNKDKGD